ncbi:hypothetical protein AB0M46_13935 [Dactylosporangium sp. NPDC051485]|uniref:hypothetical protein n=1 Tax=Dactylosporangium sp. NPDC051485 TaxID=3154846 RepID=UPI0034306F1D
MRIAKFLALPALALALTGSSLVASAGPAAANVVSGNTTLSVPLSFVVQAANAGIVPVPAKPATTNYNSTKGTLDVGFPVTGGDADLTLFTGYVQHSGTLCFVNATNGKSVTLTNLEFDVSATVLTMQPKGSTTKVILFDLVPPTTTTETGTAASFTAAGLAVDAAGASYLDSALGTTFFTAGQPVGSFASNWTEN